LSLCAFSSWCSSRLSCSSGSPAGGCSTREEPTVSDQPAFAVSTGVRRRAAGQAAAAQPERRLGGVQVRRTAGRVVEIVLLTAVALLVVSPIYWTIVTSLRTPAQ